MGVQKSRKSIKYTKYSLKLIKNRKLNNTVTFTQLQHIYARHEFRKTRVFVVNNRKSGTTPFFVQ